MTVEAAVDGDACLAEQAFLLDPLGGRGDLTQTEEMVAALFTEEARWLPQFGGRSTTRSAPREAVVR